MAAVRLFDHGRLVYGGAPARFLRLTSAGAQAVRNAVSANDPSQLGPLEAKLINSGMFPPNRPAELTAVPQFSIVIPHFNDPDGAAQTLEALEPLVDWDEPVLVIVVDDGSQADRKAALEVHLERLNRAGMTVVFVPLADNRGPSASRNAGFAMAEGDVTVFIDSGVVVEPATIGSLVRWTTSVDAVGPRIVCPDRDDAIGRYEVDFSPLDMTVMSALTESDTPRLVHPNRQVRYLPTAVLAVRNESIRAAGLFDEDMRTGEDVDLVWRLANQDRQLVYDPGLRAEHEARPTAAGFARQRYKYGQSVGPLGTRHGAQVAHAVGRPALAAAAVAAVSAPLPVAGVSAMAVLAANAVTEARRFSVLTKGYPSAGALGATESLRLNLHAGRWFLRASGRAWLPIVLVALAQPWSSLVRRRATRVLGARLMDHVATVGPAKVPLALLDEIAYGAGLWRGAVRSRSLRPLLPRIVR